MAVGVTGRDVEGIEYPGILDQAARRSHIARQLVKELYYHVSPRFLPGVQVGCLGGLLRGLLSREASPLVAFRVPRTYGLFEIPLRLSQPVFRSVAHIVLPQGGRLRVIGCSD